MRHKILSIGVLATAITLGTLIGWEIAATPRSPQTERLSQRGQAVTSPTIATGKNAPIQIPINIEPLSEQVEKLLVTHDPSKAYLAYQLISNCAKFVRYKDRLVFDKSELKGAKPGHIPGFRGMNESEKLNDAELCGDMIERQRLARLDYLAVAAQAGVDGAAEDFAREGPFGDPSALTTRPNDPLVRSWISLARAHLLAATEAGNTGAIAYVAGENYSGSELFEKDLGSAYRYDIALGLIFKELYGPDMILAKLYAVDSEQMVAAGKDLDAKERAGGLVAAQRIVDNLREQRARKH